MKEKQTKISIHQIIWYIIIFSILGMIIEMLFCYITTGVIESRKGLVWGPFCPVYGIGATILIILLNKYKDSYLKLFIYGSIIGNIIEYLLSYILEAMYGIRFWDYRFVEQNLNGRICIRYSLFWGFLAIILIKFIKPAIDKLIDKIPTNKRNIINIIIVILIIIDMLATVWAIKTYQDRVKVEYYDVKENKLEEDIKENRSKDNIIEKNAFIKVKEKIEDTLFSNEIMLNTFPNLRYIDESGKEYYIKDIIKTD